MKNVRTYTLCLTIVFGVCLALGASAEDQFRRLPVKEYRDKMKAGWIGQIIGVSWGAPTEGRYSTIMPAEKMPPFQEDLINHAFGQDDLYVEMTFLRSMEQHGWDVSIRQAGIDFANSKYALWVANDAGRRNLRNGIAPPDSSHPRFHNCPGAIDYQIESDYTGLICPGMPDMVIALGEKFGRLMNYGDGVYAGQFMGAMYAEAFFEKDIARLIEAGLKAIPRECMYAEMVRDMVQWHKENPDHWEKAWELAESKYNKDPNYNISALDVKREGAWVLMGLLYGKGDLDQTMIISCRCGFDSDCNPSSSGGILFTTRGTTSIPDKYYKKLNNKELFSYTAYTFPDLIDVCEKLARQAAVKSGGRIEKDAAGEEIFVIPVRQPTPSKFEDLKNPGPIANSLFSDEEMAQIENPGLRWALPKRLAAWKAEGVQDGSYRWEYRGQKDVFELRPPSPNAPWKLTRKLDVPAGKKTSLSLRAGLVNTKAEWELTASVEGTVLARKSISADSVTKGWAEVVVNLESFAGRSVTVEVSGLARDKDSKQTPACMVAGMTIRTE